MWYKRKKVREEFITYKEPVKQEVKEIIKEKIIIQKEAKPEIAEEGNDMHIFDMKIIKRWPWAYGPPLKLGKLKRDRNLQKKRKRKK